MSDPDAASRPGAQRAVEAWAASGAMWLTGRADGPPLGPPDGLVEALDDIAARILARSGALAREVRVDPLARLAERAAIAGLGRNGTTSCGGATRLLATTDGWIAASLARPSDVDLVPAWLGVAVDTEDPWPGVTAAVGAAPALDVVERASLLGLPVARLGEAQAVDRATWNGLPCAAEQFRDGEPAGSLDGVVVADLGSLWAGPLCSSLLAEAGATVVKVESTARPDGARRGPAAFFDRMNGGKRMLALDLGSDRGRDRLHAVLARADVVIEASRPRALAQMGIDADTLLREAQPRVWVSITAHGRSGSAGTRVGFGDDAAVAGGLVAWEDGAPQFCADAVADPTTGMVAAAATLEALEAGGHWLLDVPMAAVAASLAGPTLPAGTAVAAPPRPPDPAPPAGALGADTDAVLASWGLTR